MNTAEINFDGLVGPTHNYAGLSYGNIAATRNAMQAANPKEAALQGLQKMRRLMALGLHQAVLPPQERPHIPTLRRLGFTGDDAAVLAAAWKSAPALVRNVAAASSMWTANAATVSPSADTADGRVHFTPANLVAMFHRSIETGVTARTLRAIFPEGPHFVHHDPMPAAPQFGDEGAANHNRFCGEYGDSGIHLFVYGRRAFDSSDGPRHYPARHTLEASAAIARQHGVGRAIFVKQNPAAIDAGAFHNDVVAVSNKSVFFYHQLAYEEPSALQAELRAAADGIDLEFVEVPTERVSLEDAVDSYLFNSQLVSLPGEERMTLILPMEAAETPSTKAYVEDLVASNGPIGDAIHLDVRQSMRNGGGPACLRLRVVLTEAERAALGADVVLDETRIGSLESWVERYFRDRVEPDDVADPSLLDECRAALDELTRLLDLGPIYDFQR